MTAAVRDLVALVERTAPPELAEPWDNNGLLVGDETAPVRRAWLALELTLPLIREAAARGVDAIITHHPLIFSPLRRVTAQQLEGAMILELARCGISAINAHTSLDAAQGGVNDVLARQLSLDQIGPLPGFPCGRRGLLPSPMTAQQLMDHVDAALSPSILRTTHLPERTLQRVALCSGAGGDALEAALAWGADLLLVGEAKYHEALTCAERGLFLVEAGHDSTENVVLHPWLQHLQKLADEVQLEVEFNLATVATSPYAQPRRL